ncbi:hypothetical protein [Nocardia camponoti]|uniref:DUF4190 domain-containing protein n=1 Tax=Nocardia camponoti TaxID=1616106 RepID=A0A917Q8C8_9NOCA|nr:hypothetical protein [Nocardia camponoti]GGK34799.1 hypothetical protein GCM10011591_03050 [Nocardia camponoti]
MARYEQWDNGPEEEFDDERWDGQRWPTAEPFDHAEPDDAPRTNPYAMVALAAALIALFPIALVFGLLSFAHPRGRAMATFALLLGIGEAAVATVVALTVFGGFDVGLPALAKSTESSVATTTTATVAAAPNAPSHGAPTAPAAPVTAPVGTVVVKGSACTNAQAGLVGVSADGATLLCLKSAGAYTWSGPFRVSGSYYTEGTKCDPSTDKSGRTNDNRALVCEGKGSSATWVPWLE